LVSFAGTNETVNKIGYERAEPTKRFAMIGFPASDDIPAAISTSG
jgi:hypothetical protein